MNRAGRLGLTALTGTGTAVAMLLTGAGVAQAATGATVRTGGIPLHVRTAPSLSGTILGTLPNGSALTIACQQSGQNIAGLVRTTTAWDKLADGRYVSDAYVQRPGPAPAACAQAAQVWVSPVHAPIWGGFRTPTNPNHDGVDLGALRNTPVVSVAAGVVVTAECNVSPTTSCDVDGSPAVAGCGWYVEVRHTDNTVTRYCHMVRRPSVNVGQRVTAGQVLGYSGDSGNSSAPHLHFETHTGYPATRQNAVDPVPFMAARGVQLGR
jgi:murein DD-endopeptidase MepM/ murein hydrolase activator NlpD